MFPDAENIVKDPRDTGAMLARRQKRCAPHFCSSIRAERSRTRYLSHVDYLSRVTEHDNSPTQD
jgi:hypothetical protein